MKTFGWTLAIVGASGMTFSFLIDFGQFGGSQSIQDLALFTAILALVALMAGVGILLVMGSGNPHRHA